MQGESPICLQGALSPCRSWIEVTPEKRTRLDSATKYNRQTMRRHPSELTIEAFDDAQGLPSFPYKYAGILDLGLPRPTMFASIA